MYNDEFKIAFMGCVSLTLKSHCYMPYLTRYLRSDNVFIFIFGENELIRTFNFDHEMCVASR